MIIHDSRKASRMRGFSAVGLSIELDVFGDYCYLNNFRWVKKAR